MCIRDRQDKARAAPLTVTADFCLESIPPLPVDAAVADGFGQVGRADYTGAVQVGDGSRHFEDAVMGAGTQSQAVDGSGQQLIGSRGQPADSFNLSGIQL